MNRLFLDVETTGLSPSRCAIIELYCEAHVGNQKSELHLTMAPFEHAHIEQKALDTNHRTLDEVMSFQPSENALAAFFLWTGEVLPKGQKFTTYAYNASFDCDFVMAWHTRFNRKNEYWQTFAMPWICLRNVAQAIEVDKGLKNHKLETVYKHIFGEAIQGAHFADADVKAMIKLFYHYKHNNGLA